MRLLFYLFPFGAVYGSIVDQAVFDNRKHTSHLLDILDNKDANAELVNTVVKCLDIPVGIKIRSTDFIRCINDWLHTDDRTNTDNISFILGNYMFKSALLLYRCYDQYKDIIYCTRVFGDCLPMLLRNLFGIDEYSFKCDRLRRIEGYDGTDDDYFPEDDPVSYDPALADKIFAYDDEFDETAPDDDITTAWFTGFHDDSDLESIDIYDDWKEAEGTHE